MPALRRVNELVESSGIATSAVKEAMHQEIGAGTLPVAGEYRIFGQAFGTPPIVSIGLRGTINQIMAGTLRLRMNVISASRGSFQWRGTPALLAWFRATGVRE